MTKEEFQSLKKQNNKKRTKSMLFSVIVLNRCPETNVIYQWPRKIQFSNS